MRTWINKMTWSEENLREPKIRRKEMIVEVDEKRRKEKER